MEWMECGVQGGRVKEEMELWGREQRLLEKAASDMYCTMVPFRDSVLEARSNKQLKSKKLFLSHLSSHKLLKSWIKIKTMPRVKGLALDSFGNQKFILNLIEILLSKSIAYINLLNLDGLTIQPKQFIRVFSKANACEEKLNNVSIEGLSMNQKLLWRHICSLSETVQVIIVDNCDNEVYKVQDVGTGLDNSQMHSLKVCVGQ